MSVGFRQRDDTALVGYPTRAQPCRCGRQVVDSNDGLCVLCGREPKESIDREWAQQAWRNQKDRRRPSPRPFKELKGGGLVRDWRSAA